MYAPESNDEKPCPKAGKLPKPNSDPPILFRLAPLWRLRLPLKKSSKGSSAGEGNMVQIRGNTLNFIEKTMQGFEFLPSFFELA